MLKPRLSMIPLLFANLLPSGRSYVLGVEPYAVIDCVLA